MCISSYVMTTCCIVHVIFYKFCSLTKHGGIITNLTQRNPWGYIIDMSKYHNVVICMEHGLKDAAFYVQTQIAPWAICYNRTLVCDIPQGAPAFVRLIYSLWPGDAIWGHKIGSTLAQVMACFLMALNHYLNQCWLIISGNHLRAISQEIPQPSIIKINLKDIYLKSHLKLPGSNELIMMMSYPINGIVDIFIEFGYGVDGVRSSSWRVG